MTGSLDNAGLLWASTTSGVAAVRLAGGGSLSNSGTVIAEAHSGEAVAITAEDTATSGIIVNAGNLFALSTTGNASGIRIAQAAYTIENDGTIAVQAFQDPDSRDDPWAALTSGRASGIVVSAGSVPVINGASGQILVEGDHAFAIWLRGSTSGASYDYDLDNRGLIRAASTLLG